jgi:GDPmannose 4,6-dehydratase
VRKFAELAFSYTGLEYRRYVKPDPELYRPAEVNLPRGDARKARRVLGWRHRIGFEELVRDMVDEDRRAVGVERAKK